MRTMMRGWQPGCGRDLGKENGMFKLDFRKFKKPDDNGESKSFGNLSVKSNFCG